MAVGGQDIIKTGTTPPSAPTGYASIWVDSTTKRAKLIDDAGTASDLHAGIYKLTGSVASPTVITAAGGITPAGYYREMIFTASASGAVLITKDPAIAAGTIPGQLLILVGTSDTNYLGIQSDTGIKTNGIISLVADKTMTFIWTGSKWVDYAI